MMLGVGLTLAAVALLTVLARDSLTRFAARYEASLDRVGRLLDGAVGALLVLIGLRTLLR